MRGRRTRSVAFVVAALVALSACGQSEPEDVGAEPPAEPPVPELVEEEPPPAATTEVEDPEEGEPEGFEPTLVATSTVADIEVFADPDETSERTHTLNHPTDRGVPRVFLVEQRRDGWLEVLLPVRPNGSSGWIREADASLATNPYEVDVDLSAFLLTVHREGELILETPIGYGDQDTPTPGGRYYTTELLQPPDPTGVYGPFAFGLSGFSDVHLSFAGGEGVIGIHGTNEPDSIGTTVSNGCIRIDNDVVTELATYLPLGTPVTIS